MFENFAANFALTPVDQSASGVWAEPSMTRIPGYVEFATRYAGCTFNDGIYRVHNVKSAERSLQSVNDYFPNFRGALLPFGFDWLGRQFAVDARRGIESPVFMLQPGTGDALEIPLDFVAFHDEELVADPESALAQSYFEQWVDAASPNLPLSASECVGFKIPLFLGGEDRVENLELVEMDFYWELSAQMHGAASTLPPGTSISSVRIVDS